MTEVLAVILFLGAQIGIAVSETKKADEREKAEQAEIAEQEK